MLRLIVMRKAYSEFRQYISTLVHCRLIAELPDPAHIRFEEHGLQVTVWYDFAGHFTNKVYIFSSVDQLPNSKNKHGEEAEYIARLRFPAVSGAYNKTLSN